jgi:uncharacterized protein YciI
MRRIRFFAVALSLCISCGMVAAQSEAPKPNPRFDPQLAKKYGADKNGMKTYVLAILKTGAAKVPPGKERDEIFKGHFANIKRLAAEGKLAVAGPFDSNSSAFRGIFILNVPTVEEARKLTDTDPVVKSGLMVVDHYVWYGSAALMETPEIHEKLSETAP